MCNGLGCFEEPYDIVVDQDTLPVKEPPRRVPFGLQDRMKLKLDLMEKYKVIQEVNKPTDWVHNLVIVEKKDGSLRLCLDPRELNKAIKRENFHIPTVEDVTCRLSGKKVFTLIDLKDAFWQVPLSEESASLTTFNTPFGRYFFKRMPFGLCSASEVIQKRVYQICGDIDDVHVIADDIIIASNSEEEADRTHQVVQPSPGEEREVQHREIAAKQIGSELHGQHNRFQRGEARPNQSRSIRQYARTIVQERHSASDRNAELLVTVYTRYV